MPRIETAICNICGGHHTDIQCVWRIKNMPPIDEVMAQIFGDAHSQDEIAEKLRELREKDPQGYLAVAKLFGVDLARFDEHGRFLR